MRKPSSPAISMRSAVSDKMRASSRFSNVAPRSIVRGGGMMHGAIPTSRLSIDVEPHSGDVNRAAIAVVCRMQDELVIRRNRKPARQATGVVEFENAFAAGMVKPAIADDEAVTA